jgi:hypothetical protein
LATTGLRIITTCSSKTTPADALPAADYLKASAEFHGSTRCSPVSSKIRPRW